MDCVLRFFLNLDGMKWWERSFRVSFLCCGFLEYLDFLELFVFLKDVDVFSEFKFRVVEFYLEWDRVIFI